MGSGHTWLVGQRLERRKTGQLGMKVSGVGVCGTWTKAVGMECDHLCNICQHPVVSISPGRGSVQSLSCIQLFVTPWSTACQASLSITNSQSLLKLTPIQSVMPSSHLIFCHPLLPPSVFPSIRVFSNESVLHIKWPKYWSFSFSINPSNEYSGLIAFRMDWFDLLAAPGKGTINQTEQPFQVSSTSPCPWPYWCWHSNFMNRGHGARDVGYA